MCTSRSICEQGISYYHVKIILKNKIIPGGGNAPKLWPVLQKNDKIHNLTNSITYLLIYFQVL